MSKTEASDIAAAVADEVIAILDLDHGVVLSVEAEARLQSKLRQVLLPEIEHAAGLDPLTYGRVQ